MTLFYASVVTKGSMYVLGIRVELKKYFGTRLLSVLSDPVVFSIASIFVITTPPLLLNGSDVVEDVL